jgi:hypothetical protein
MPLAVLNSLLHQRSALTIAVGSRCFGLYMRNHTLADITRTGLFTMQKLCEARGVAGRRDALSCSLMSLQRAIEIRVT